MASGTATILLINPDNETFLVGIRGKDVSVYPGFHSLPGGFMEAKYAGNATGYPKPRDYNPSGPYEEVDIVMSDVHSGETLEETACREVLEETNIIIRPDELELFHVCSDPDADPRAHVINVCYYVELRPDQVDSAIAGDDLDSIEWWDISRFEMGWTEHAMAFNHEDLTKRGLKSYQHEHQLVTNGW